jgi:predicted thioesterase
VSAVETYADGRLHRFEVVARHTDDSKVVGHGEVTRVVVDTDRFLARLT